MVKGRRWMVDQGDQQSLSGLDESGLIVDNGVSGCWDWTGKMAWQWA